MTENNTSTNEATNDERWETGRDVYRVAMTYDIDIYGEQIEAKAECHVSFDEDTPFGDAMVRSYCDLSKLLSEDALENRTSFTIKRVAHDHEILAQCTDTAPEWADAPTMADEKPKMATPGRGSRKSSLALGA